MGKKICCVTQSVVGFFGFQLATVPSVSADGEDD